jgi:peptidoglycan/LPS O-acetylase OafA/YrhL
MPGTAVASIEVDTLAREVYPHVDTRKRRNGNLDALRGIAILLVFGRHFGGNALWNQIGWAGVDLFFVLSGFLISGLLFHDWQEYGSLRIGRFYWRRALKIYPSFYFLMGITVLVEGLRPGGLNLVWPMTPAHLAAELFFLQNYAVGMWGHTWSLGRRGALLCLPAASASLHPKKRPRSIWAIAHRLSVVATLCLLLRLTTGEAGHYGTRIAPTHLRGR